MEEFLIVTIAVLLGGCTGYSNYVHRTKTETNTTHTRILIEQLVETQKTLQILQSQTSANQS